MTTYTQEQFEWVEHNLYHVELTREFEHVFGVDFDTSIDIVQDILKDIMEGLDV